jgi:hypothetical protein
MKKLRRIYHHGQWYVDADELLKLMNLPCAKKMKKSYPEIELVSPTFAMIHEEDVEEFTAKVK